MNIYGTSGTSEIHPRTTAYVVRDLLKRGMPYLVFEKLGQAKMIPKNSSDTIKFRRYYLNGATFDDLSGDYDGRFTPAEYWHDSDTASNMWDYTTTNNGSNLGHVLAEGTTPDAIDLDSEDISATLVQLGDRTIITDKIADTHEDNVLQEAIEILGEQAAFVVERHRFGILQGCTNLFYSGGTSKVTVDEPVNKDFQRKVTRALKRNLAKPITKIVKSTVNYGTQAVAPAFVCVVHPDLEADIRDMSGFKSAEDYGATAMENEIGTVEGVRYIASTVCQPSLGGGASGSSTYLNDGSNYDIYPMVFLAKEAYGCVALKGANAITPMVVNPGTPSDSDPLGQRGHVAWKTYTSTVILNPAWMAIAWVACTE
jgi:N4-gp56 family major capsid protein